MAHADLKAANGKTIIITGAANGIGAETARLFHQHGANVVIADLPSSQSAAEELIETLSPERALFVPTNILSWTGLLALFRRTNQTFGRVDIVIANAGLMESNHLFQLGVDSNNDPIEPKEHHRVIDVNVKGTLNTLTLAMHHMKAQDLPSGGLQHRGSVVLLISTSGYFGGSGVMAYVSSKHGITGMFRACQKEAAANKVRVNAVAPYFTPTHMTGSFAQQCGERGGGNGVGREVDGQHDSTGQQTREIETARTALIPTWLGTYMSDLLAAGGKFFESTGGYLLPKARP